MKGVVFNREAYIQGLSHNQTFAGIIRHLWSTSVVLNSFHTSLFVFFL